MPSCASVLSTTILKSSSFSVRRVLELLPFCMPSLSGSFGGPTTWRESAVRKDYARKLKLLVSRYLYVHQECFIDIRTSELLNGGCSCDYFICGHMWDETNQIVLHRTNPASVGPVDDHQYRGVAVHSSTKFVSSLV